MTEPRTPATSWGDYVADLAAQHGSLAALALKLALSDKTGEDADAASVERALRRLRTRGHADGGKYGAWLLRTFGMPRAVEERAKWMGVYHSRFTDLPVPLCLDQLRLWDRPPLAESRTRTWLSLGYATCALRGGKLDEAEGHLVDARGGHGVAAARIETRLLESFLASRKGDGARSQALLEEIEPSLSDPSLERAEAICLRARWLDQAAYRRLHPEGAAAPALEAAAKLYEAIPSVDAPFFAACKRESGLAYVRHRQGAREEAIAHAQRACDHAGDGGFVRLRIAALGLLAHVLGATEGEEARARAKLAARSLEDEDLLQRLALTAHDGVDRDRAWIPRRHRWPRSRRSAARPRPARAPRWR